MRFTLSFLEFPLLVFFAEKAYQYLQINEDDTGVPSHLKNAKKTFCTMITRINNSSQTIGKDGKVILRNPSHVSSKGTFQSGCNNGMAVFRSFHRFTVSLIDKDFISLVFDELQ